MGLELLFWIYLAILHTFGDTYNNFWLFNTFYLCLKFNVKPASNWILKNIYDNLHVEKRKNIDHNFRTYGYNVRVSYHDKSYNKYFKIILEIYT